MTADLLAKLRNIGGKRWVYGTAAALIVLHVLLAVAGTWNKSATFDENAYIGNGFSFWARNDYRMSPDAILPERWLTWPIYTSGAKPVPLDKWFWREGDVWRHATDFMYRQGNDAQDMLRTARFMITLLSATLAWVTFLWAKSLYGTAGGFVVLVLYVFSPLLLAHGSNATSDVAAALAFTGSLWALWVLLHRLTPTTLLVSSLAIACAFVTKLSTLLLVPIGLLMVVVQLVGRKPLEWRLGRRGGTIGPWWARGIAYLAFIVVHVIVTWAVIWTMFGFRYSTFAETDGDPGKSYFGSWDDVMMSARKPLPGHTDERNVAAVKFAEFAATYRLLPEGYLLTFINSLTTTAVRSSFLNGRYGIYGFASFFPLGFLYKTPPSVFVLMWMAVVTYLLRTAYRIRGTAGGRLKLLWSQFYSTAPLWFLLVVYWTLSITRGINIGLRHMLPTYPATFILLGGVGIWLCRRMSTPKIALDATSPSEPTTTSPSESLPPNDSASEANDDPSGFRLACSSQIFAFMRAIVVVCLAWLVVDVALIRGNYLAYFNFIAGGPSNGYRHLIDSSLDWGQELWGLKRWLDEHAEELPPNVYVSYFGSTPPSYYGLEAHWLPSFLSNEILEDDRKQPKEATLQEGIYCISATSLQCVYNGNFSGPWRDDFEYSYRTLHNLIMNFVTNQNNPAERDARLAATGLPDWNTAVRLFEEARFGRLCEYLRRREPDDMVNYAILIYRLSATELREAMMNAPLEHYPPPKSPNDNVPY